MKWILAVALTLCSVATSHACDGLFGRFFGRAGSDCGQGFGGYGSNECGGSMMVVSPGWGCNSGNGTTYYTTPQSTTPYYSAPYYPGSPTIAPETKAPTGEVPPGPTAPVPMKSTGTRSWRIKLGEPVATKFWIRIYNNGELQWAPVLNGYMPELRYDERGIIYHYGLRIPYGETHVEQIAKTGYVDYSPRTSALEAHYARRSAPQPSSDGKLVVK